MSVLVNHGLRRASRKKIPGRGRSYGGRLSNRVTQIAIVGGGTTGVELAVELYDAASALRQYGLDDFDESRLEVTLLEAGPRILTALPEKLAAAAHEERESLGVRILVDTRVSAVDGDGVHTGDGEVVAADIKVWAAGIRGADFLDGIGGLETTRSNIHLLTIHGWLRGVLLIAIGRVNQVVRPRLELH